MSDTGQVKFFCLGVVRLGWVSHLWFRFGLGKFPLKNHIFQIFALWVKKSHRVESKSTQVKARVKVSLGQGPSLAQSFKPQLYIFST